MKNTFLIILFTVIAISCEENKSQKVINSSKPGKVENLDNQKRKDKLRREILDQYSQIPKIYYGELEIDGYGSPEFNEIMKSISQLKKTNYGKENLLKLNILEFKILLLYKQNKKALEKINELDNNENEIIKNLYKGIYYDITGNKVKAKDKYDSVYTAMIKNGIYDYNCLHFNLILILADKSLKEIKDCNSQNSPTNQYQELKRMDRKDLIFKKFFYQVEI